MRDGNDLEYSLETLQPASIDSAIIADDTHGGPLPTRNGPGIVTHLLDDSDDSFDLFGRSHVLHDNEHQQLSWGVGAARSSGTARR